MKIKNKTITVLIISAILVAPILRGDLCAQPSNWYQSSLLNGWTFDPPQVSASIAIIEDFQVNENAGYCSKYNPAIAADKNGNVIMVWKDLRDGDARIYGQRYNSAGNALGMNFKVGDETGRSVQEHPAVAMDGIGNFVVVWYDTWSGLDDIYAQRFNSSGVAQGATFKVNDDSGYKSQQNPAVAADLNGNFIVAWQDERSGNSVIYAQRYNVSGNALGANFIVSGDIQSYGQSDPAIAMGGNGSFVVIWTDVTNGNGDIYVQLYTSTGVKNGSKVHVSDDSGTSEQGSAAVAVNINGEGMVVWTDERNGNKDIYAQNFNVSGVAYGKNYKINDDSGISLQDFPAITVDRLGYFAIAWLDRRNGNYDIYVKRYGNPMTPQLPDFRVNDDTGTTAQVVPAIAMDENGNFTVAWVDERNGVDEIYAQRYNYAAVPQKTNFWVNDDNGSTGQFTPAIAVNASGSFMVVWQDNRNGAPDIFAQFYNKFGIAQGTNFKVNDDAGYSLHSAPDISADGVGNFVVAWMDTRNGEYDIYAQRYDSLGNAIRPNFKVNDNHWEDWQKYPAVAADGSGNFVVVWEDFRDGDNDIYAQRFNSYATAQGGNFKVNDDASKKDQSFPAIAMAKNGNFIITWEDKRNGNYDIYAQRYNNSGVAQKSNFWINDDSGNTWQNLPAIAVDGIGNFTIVWEDSRNTYRDIYAQRYNSAGNAQGGNYRVNELEVGFSQTDAAIAANSNGEVVITWTDYRNFNPDIYAKRLDSQGNATGVDFCVTKNKNLHQTYPRVQLRDKKIYTAWQSDHVGGTGYDIWANVLDWNTSGTLVAADDGQEQPSCCELLQNFPNPANPTTTIRYRLSEQGLVIVKIFDLAGRIICVLQNEIKDKGLFEIRWDGKDRHGIDIPSGVYFYQLRTGSFQQTKRLILLH